MCSSKFSACFAQNLFKGRALEDYFYTDKNPLFIEHLSWLLRKQVNFLGCQIYPALLYSPWPSVPVPGLHILLVIMTFLPNKRTLLVLLFYCFCEWSCFEISSMAEKFNFVPPTLLSPLSFRYNQEPLMRKSQLRDGETFVNTITSCSVDSC